MSGRRECCKPMVRLATEKEATNYIGLDLATFRTWVECGSLPKPLADCGKFDLKAIDAALDRISGLGGASNALDAWRERRTVGGAMRVRLKGIATATATLSNGERVTYHYAWRGGPRLMGRPGSPEFLASYEAAHRGRRRPDVSLFRSIITEYLKSEAFTGTRKRTQADYLKQIAKIEAAFGDLPLAALADPRVTKDLLDWRDSMAASPRQADYAWTVFMRLVSWARGRGLTTYRPPERVERLYHADRAEKIWTEEHVASFMAAAPCDTTTRPCARSRDRTAAR